MASQEVELRVKLFEFVGRVREDVATLWPGDDKKGAAWIVAAEFWRDELVTMETATALRLTGQLERSWKQIVEKRAALIGRKR